MCINANLYSSVPLLGNFSCAIKMSSLIDTSPQNEESVKDNSDAANFNERVLRKVQKALAKDPQADITTLLPLDYSARLASRKIVKGKFYMVFLDSITD